MNNQNKILNPEDIKDIKIQKVLWSDTNWIKDIIVILPEKYGIEPISFFDIGLINTSVEAVEYIGTIGEMPRVKIEFYGVLEEVDENTQES